MKEDFEQSFDLLNSDGRIKLVLTTLKNTANEIQNDWNSKEREQFIFDKLIKLNFI